MARTTPMKVCRKCGEDKTLDCYSTYDNGVGTGLRHRCKECRNKKVRGKRKESSRTYYEKNSERLLLKSKAYYQSEKEAIKARSFKYYRENSEQIKIRSAALKYNIAEDEVKRIKSSPCEVCSSDGKIGKGSIHIDHCHESGKVRGGLCHNCNIALGLLKDDPELIQKLKDYLIASK